MQPISAQKTCMKRLRNLMKEYNTLEKEEEKLLGMLDHVRQEERYLVRALHDEIETNNEIIDPDESSPTKEPTPAPQIFNEASQGKEDESEKLSTQQNVIQSNEEHDIQQGETEQMETTAATTADDTVADAATRPTKRYRRGRARAAMDKDTEVKKRGQEIEQQRLARQRLENALFADDDDDDDDSSSTSS